MAGRDTDAAALFEGPGEARRAARAVDWERTPLGPVEDWPPALRSTVRLCLECRTAMAIWAGPDLTLVYNDGYPPVLGPGKHPWAMGRPLREVWAEVADQIGPQFRDVTERGEAIRLEEVPYRLVRNDRQEEGYFTYTLTPLRDDGGRILGAFNVCEEVTRTVTAARQSAARLEEADRRKSHFLAVLSHELRNPLAPVKNGLYILDRAPAGSEQARRAKEIVGRQVDLLTRLVDDLLDVTRIARGKVQLQRRRLELNELVRRAVEDHRGQLEGAGIAVRLELAAAPTFVGGDGSRLAQAIGNLLQNAAKFTPRGGHVAVEVAVDAAAREAAVRVSDTGAGMAPEVLAHLFEPFMQADETLDRSQGGLGLGLALVKGLVELHGGRVEARSAGPGRGAELTIRLPLDPVQAAEPVRAGGPPAPARRVLVIEDNADAAQTLQDLLRLHGHEVAVASDGPAGLEKARTFRPDVVLCDIGLPGMDGYAVARALRADPALRGARLVALTGYAQPEDVQRARAAGFDLHVAKPPTREKLEAVLGGAPPWP